MTYPENRTPLTGEDLAKLHPSTWEAQCAQLVAENEQLRARVATLEAALQPFSEFAGELFARNCNKGQIVVAMNTPEKENFLTFDDFLEARAALEAKP